MTTDSLTLVGLPAPLPGTAWVLVLVWVPVSVIHPVALVADDAPDLADGESAEELAFELEPLVVLQAVPAYVLVVVGSLLPSSPEPAPERSLLSELDAAADDASPAPTTTSSNAAAPSLCSFEWEVRPSL